MFAGVGMRSADRPRDGPKPLIWGTPEITGFRKRLGAIIRLLSQRTN